MGEAKRKLEQVRHTFLADLGEWMFPPSDWETRTVAEIQALPVVIVTRRPDRDLEYMRMPAKQCHENAHFLQVHDPEGLMRHVTGWWVQDGNYVLHSVVEKDGHFFCVTPAPAYVEKTFDFIPDDKIEWRVDGEHMAPFRDGVEVGRGVRTDAAATIAELEVLRQRLLSGMNPYKAVRKR
ncbi:MULTISPECIES: hypothetical protein [unclassified Xanthobacter]|uniref:hypothetical protein n=1 Tax=unclassified Xanthobacter TaxID=2623496 RepID=UPI001F2C75C5|nr:MULTISPECIES: hypothetical protein [unclassified Xanthobacter]